MHCQTRYAAGSKTRRNGDVAGIYTNLTDGPRAYRVVYHSSSLAGQVAAVESGLAVAVLTRCSVPASLQPLQNLPKEFELPALGSMDVAVFRSKVSQRSRAVEAMYEQCVNTLGK